MRKYRITALLLSVCMALSMFPAEAFASEVKTIVLHVSADAKISGNGSELSPFRTIEEARLALRDMNHKKKRVEVLIHGGTYHFSKRVSFDEKDSGSADYPVVYKAAGDGEVIFTGATTLDIMSFEPVTDKKIYTRLPEVSRNNIGVLSLAEYDFDKGVLDLKARYTSSTTPPPDARIYFNGRMQTIARYPNTGYQILNTVVDAGDTNTEGNGRRGVFRYETLAPERWKSANHAFICGYMGSEYTLDWTGLGAIDTENKTITVTNPTNYGIKAGHRWFAQNLLEEIDVPGEYFIDPEELKLYYYPTQKLSSEDTLEITTYKDLFLYLNGVSHVEFNGISFRHTLDDGIQLKGCSNVTIRSCELWDIGCDGIVLHGRNTLIEGCTIRETGTNGITVSGAGEWATYTPSNNRIANNHFYNFAIQNQMLYKYAISLGRNSSDAVIGDVVENNIMHGQPGAGAIIYGGLENVIRYNEMYALSQDCADAGVVYAGRRLNEFGNLIEYNYIHDYGSIFGSRYRVVAIYWDDNQSGQTAKHNICVPNNKNKTSMNLQVGAFNTMTENIVVNSNTGVQCSDRKAATTSTAYKTLSSATKSPAAVQKKWPQMAYLKQLLDAADWYFPVINNTVTHNLNVACDGITIADTVKQYGTVENNPMTDDYGVFVDAENHDFRLTAEAMEKYGFPETMINETNFDMDSIGIRKEVFDIQKPQGSFKQIYPANGQTNVPRMDAFLKWETALYADSYEYIVARDPELTDIVESGTTCYSFVNLEKLENGQTYYYKVYAKNLSKQIGNKWASEGVPYMFTVTASDDLDKSFLNDEIESLEKAAEKIVVGDKIGDYMPEVVPEIENLLIEAKAVAGMQKGQQGEVDNMAVKIRNFRNLIDSYRYGGHTATEINGKWLTNSENAVVTPSDGGVKIEAVGASSYAWLDKKISNFEAQHFKMKINFNGWSGLSLRQTDTALQPYSKANYNYLVVIKPDIIEFQKYSPQAAATGIISTYPNTFIKDGEWCDVQFSAVNVIGGVEVVLKVNGEEIFSYYDNENPNMSEGHFSVIPGSEGASVELKTAEAVPTGFYEFSLDEALAGKLETVYTKDSDIFRKEGAWEEGPTTGLNKAPLYISEDKTAKASYTITDTLVSYHLSYYHTPYEEADKNETMTIRFYTPQFGGEMEIVKKIDFTSGEKGWIDIGAFECSSAGQTGHITVEFAGSGEGVTVAPMIKARKVEGDEYEFSRLFYDHATNLLMMQINNTKAFKTMTPVTIPDTAPYIENNITMVPLRFVSEAFDAQVTWDGENNKVYIASGDTSIEFTLGSKVYTVNGEARESEAAAALTGGRTMIPLRATAEALGKKVYWNSEHSMIFIADNFNFTESDSSKFELAAKGFQGGF